MAILTSTNGNYTPSRANLEVVGTLGALNAEAVINITNDVVSGGTQGGGESIVSIDLRGTFVATVVLEGSIDGINYTTVVLSSGLLSVSAPGSYQGIITGFTMVRARISAFTSGIVTANMVVSTGSNVIQGSQFTPTALGTANTALTLTIPAQTGLRFYLTGLYIQRVNGTVTAVTASALLSITTTNLPTNTGWTTDNGIGAWATRVDVDQKFSAPVASLLPSTAVTIVCPIPGAGVQWRIIAEGFYGV